MENPTNENVANIMRGENGQPVFVPGKDDQKMVRDANGNPIVPQGTQQPLNAVPKDTMPRSVIAPQIPTQAPEMIRETSPQRAVEGTTTYEELAAKKGFRSADELAKAYANLESQNSRVEATLSDAIRARQEGLTNQSRGLDFGTTPQSGKTDEEEMQRAQSSESTEDALKIVNSIVDRKLNTMRDSFDYQLHLMANPTDKLYAQQAIQYVKENPGIHWDVAFKAAKADAIASTAREQGRQEAYQNIEQKQGAQAVHGGVNYQEQQQVTTQALIQGIRSGQIPLAEAKRIINATAQQ